MVANMKEAIVAKGPKVTIKDVPIPEPGPDQVVIKVVVSGSNPKDWYVYHLENINSLPALSRYSIYLPIPKYDN
jgi:NADPH:quinone reductase-like Zn-dependent oxidoreductase